MPQPTIIEVVYLVCITHVWARSVLFRWIRTHGPKAWTALADCPMCSGFWIGLLGHALYLYAPNVVTCFGVGSLVGTSALALYGAIRRL